MRLFIHSLIAIVLFVDSVSAQDEADNAIDDAISLLKQRQATISDEASTAKLQEAIEGLRLVGLSDGPAEYTSRRIVLEKATMEREPYDLVSPADRPPALAVKITDFIDHTEQYRGRTITLPLTLRTLVRSGRGESLRDLRGTSARFVTTADDGNRLDLQIDLPAGLDLPKASFSDRLIVTFQCRAGNLRHGNQAIAVRRPG
jgi:hypothetical protein